MADPGLVIKAFSLLAAAPSGEQGVDLVVNPLPNSFSCRPAEQGCPQDDPATRGYRRRTPSNETLFGEPGRFYVYVSYGIHHCVNVVTHRADWANGVLLRAASISGEPERLAAGPALYGTLLWHRSLPRRPAGAF